MMLLEKNFFLVNNFNKVCSRPVIRNENDLLNNARYIIANPLRAKIVDKIASYPYWDCIYIK